MCWLFRDQFIQLLSARRIEFVYLDVNSMFKFVKIDRIACSFRELISFILKKKTIRKTLQCCWMSVDSKKSGILYYTE